MNKLFHLILKSDIISFDIFDTLLKRNVRHPKDIFDIVEIRYNSLYNKELNSFRKNRVLAENDARATSINEDISLNEIYDKLPYDKETAELLKEVELSVEFDALVFNRDMMKVFQFALQNQKKVIIVSDMYLPKHFLEKILKREGFAGYEKLYVSNEDGALKSTGNLFRKVLDDFGCHPKKILHIGDSKKGDWLAPLKLGIKTYPIKTHYCNLSYHEDLHTQSLSRNIIYSFLNNSIEGNRFFKIGYETLGPLLYGFIEWTHSKVKEKKLKQLLFFSRDGEIMKKVYDILYPEEEAHYVYVSRRSLLVPLFWNCSSWDEILNLIPLTRYVQLKAFFEMIGLSSSLYENVICRFGFNPSEFIELDAFYKNEKMKRLLSNIWDDVISNSKKEFENFRSYIKSLNVHDNYGIVDIGWKGTMQRSYEKLLRLLGEKHSVTGFYLGLTSTLERGNAYLFSKQNPTNELKVWSFLGLFEMLFSASHGSVKRYVNKKNHPVELYDFEFDYNDDTKASYCNIKEIQKGALLFIQQFRNYRLSSFVQWTPNVAFEGVFNLGVNTKKDDLKDISSWKFFNTTLLPLAVPKFSLKLSNIKTDFSNSAWKIAYLKNLMKIPLPYFKLYSFLKKIL